jgi:hypothetical protein
LADQKASSFALIYPNCGKKAKARNVAGLHFSDTRLPHVRR